MALSLGAEIRKRGLMRVMVTGATGFLGSSLVRKLCGMGLDVSILARPNSDLKLLKDAKFKIVEGDVCSVDSLNSAFEGHEFVFHLAGVVAYRRSQRLNMEKVNVSGTHHVLQAAQKCKIKRLIHCSSVVAVGASPSPKQILNEKSHYKLQKYNLGYFETKRKAELLVVDAARSGLIDAVCVNPSTIYGPGDASKGSRNTQLKVARGKMPFYTTGGVSVVDLDDVIDGMIKAWQNGRPGERYILSGENITIKELFQKIASAAKVEPPKILMPKPILFGLGYAGDLLNSMGLPSGLSVENAMTATMYHWFDCTKAKTELGFVNRPADESIRKSIEWAKANGLL